MNIGLVTQRLIESSELKRRLAVDQAASIYRAAVEMARERGLSTIGLTGGDGGLLAGRVDIAIVVPSTSTARIQECHITIGHIVCEVVEDLLMDEAPMRHLLRQNEPTDA